MRACEEESTTADGQQQQQRSHDGDERRGAQSTVDPRSFGLGVLQHCSLARVHLRNSNSFQRRSVLPMRMKSADHVDSQCPHDDRRVC